MSLLEGIKPQPGREAIFLQVDHAPPLETIGAKRLQAIHPMWCSGMMLRLIPMLEARSQSDSASLRRVNGTALGSPEVPLVSRMRISSSLLMLVSLLLSSGARISSGRSNGMWHHTPSALRGRSTGRRCWRLCSDGSRLRTL